MSASAAADRAPHPRSAPPPASTERGVDPLVAAVLRRIDECAALGPDGDSYGGEPLSPVARAEASRWVEIVADLCGARVGAAARPASVAPLADGGVQIEWRGPGDVLALEVGPAGELGSLCLAAAAGGPTRRRGRRRGLV